MIMYENLKSIDLTICSFISSFQNFDLFFLIRLTIPLKRYLYQRNFFFLSISKAFGKAKDKLQEKEWSYG